MEMSARLSAVALLAGLVMIGCGAGASALTAEEILANAAQATLEIDTVQFAIERQGEPPVIEPTTGATFISATGFYAAPETVQATIRAETPLGVQDLGLSISPEGNSLTIPGLGTVEIPDDFGYSPVLAFQQEGIPTVLTTAIVEPVLEGEESLEGVPTYRISGRVSGESLTNVLAGIITVEDMGIEVWVDRETFQVVRVVLTEATGDRWVLDLFGYGEEPVG